MKHRVTNFGSEPLEVRTDPGTAPGDVTTIMVPPGTAMDATIISIHHGPYRTHYSVRPAERAVAPDLPIMDEED